MTSIASRIALLVALSAAAACVDRQLQPVTFDAASESCRECRMTGSDGRTAAQLVTSDAEPLFFDDIGCLRAYLARVPMTAASVVFVADFSSRRWIPAADAVFVEQPSIATPMNSHLVAFSSDAAREASAAARTGRIVAVKDVLGRTP